MNLKLDLNLLPVLEALICEASVSGAAERLGITQSAVSHSLRRLRSHLDDPLFVRSGNRMLPTPRLLAIRPIVCNTMDNLRVHLGSSSSFDPKRATKTFTVNTTDVGEVVIGPAVIAELRRLAPLCRLRIVSMRMREIQVALEEGEIDLAIGAQEFTVEGLYQQVLMQQELVCLASRAHYKNLSAFKDPELFASLPHVAISPFRQDEDTYQWAFDRVGISRRFVCTLRSFVAVPLLVAQSDFVATVPDLLAHRLPASNLRILPLPFPSPDIPVRQTWHTRYHSDPANTWLRHMIYSVLSKRDSPPRSVESRRKRQ